MKSWIKLLADYDGHKSGEVLELDSAEARTLVKMKQAEDATAPAEAVAKATELSGSLQAFVEEKINAGVNAGMDRLIKELKPVGAKARNPNVNITVHENEADDPKLGWKHIGEQLMAVKNYAIRNGPADPRLDRGEKSISMKAPANYSSEGIGADGGFAVAPDFLPELLQYLYTDDALMARCRPLTTSGNTITVPKDETVPWGTDGIQAYWANEAATFTSSKAKLGEINIQLHKLTALVPVTNELLEDSAFSLGTYIGRQAPIKIADKINGAIVAGNGAGQPLGVLNSGAIITQPKDAGQATKTISVTNIAGMYSLVPKAFRRNAVWLHHSTVLPQIMSLVIGQQPAFFPPGGIQTAMPPQNIPAGEGTLWGKPLVESEQCQSLTNLGDLYLIDFSQYLLVTKSNGIRQEMSIHLYFDQDLTAFRFVFRVGGQPWMQKPITQKNGGGTLSPFVNLQAR